MPFAQEDTHSYTQTRPEIYETGVALSQEDGKELDELRSSHFSSSRLLRQATWAQNKS